MGVKFLGQGKLFLGKIEAIADGHLIVNAGPVKNLRELMASLI